MFEGEQNIDEIVFVQDILRPGMVFFDVGSNQGEYSILAARLVRPAGRVFAFEPVPSIFSMLISNIALNRLGNVSPHNLALGATAGYPLMYEALGRNSGLSSLMPLNVAGPVETAQVKVQLSTMDDFVSQNQIAKIDIAKIDVEGGELNVISGGEMAWRRLRPIAIVEVQDRRTAPWGYEARQIIESLRAHDYVWFEFAGGGRLRPHAQKLHYEYCNLVAIPSEKTLGLSHLMKAESWLRPAR